jgi:tRNA pseudouridine55 synthase
MLHGWIILDKPVGLGSTQAVSAVKRALREAGEPKTKVGHGGTLDQLASGVLPIALGEATKLAGRMLDATKAYEFTIRFGEQTDTLDTEGEVVAVSAARPSQSDVEAALQRFTGEIEQVPPVYSALKIGGKRASDRARAGETVEIKPRTVTIEELRMIAASGDEVTLAATVSKTTGLRYLRRLDELGLVMRAPHPTDHRSSQMALTDDGLLHMQSYLARLAL